MRLVRLAFACVLGCFLSGCGREPVERVEWPTMGTVAALQFRGADGDCHGAVGKGRYVCELVTRRFNAHDPSSEIRGFASLSDEQVLERADAFSRRCYEAAFRLARESEGAFNPRWRGTNTLDCGAIAKGYALDDFYGEYRGLCRADTLFDLGGNLKAVKGDWTVGIKDGESFVLHEGEACATSARYYRGDHIKDGRTGADVTNGVYSVTVIHPTSAMLADGLSTTLFVLGREKGDAFLKKHYPEARAVWIHAGL